MSIGFVHSVANAPHVTSPCSLLGIANATKDVNMWSTSDKDYTKFPLTKREDVGQAPTGFFPYTSVPNLEGGVTYFMC